MRAWIFFSSLLFAFRLQAVPRHELTFKDPITGRTGLYTVGWDKDSDPKNQGLLIFFHGSGNSSGYAGVFDQLAEVGKEFDLAALAIQAPNHAITWPDGPNAPDNHHVAYVRSLLEREIFLKHPGINRKRLFFVGFSAGSTFLSGDFLPAAIQEYQGGAVMLCGGGQPLQASPAALRPLTASEAQNFRLYFYIQKNDFLYAQTQQGAAYWRDRKAQVTMETPEGGGHCAFDLPTVLKRGIKSLIEK